MTVNPTHLYTMPWPDMIFIKTMIIKNAEGYTLIKINHFEPSSLKDRRPQNALVAVNVHDNGDASWPPPQSWKGRISGSSPTEDWSQNSWWCRGDIRHTWSPEIKDSCRRIKDSLPEIKGYKSPYDIANPIENKVDSVSNQLPWTPALIKGL